MTETWIWYPGQEDDTRSSDGTGARCCTLPHPQKTVDLALRPVQAGNPTNRVPGNSVVARVSLGQCGGVCDGTQWAAARALPRSPLPMPPTPALPYPPTPAPTPPYPLGPPGGCPARRPARGPRLLRPNPPCGPRSPGSASVPRRAILQPNSPSYPTSRGPTNPVGTDRAGRWQHPAKRDKSHRRLTGPPTTGARGRPRTPPPAS